MLKRNYNRTCKRKYRDVIKHLNFYFSIEELMLQNNAIEVRLFSSHSFSCNVEKGN